MNVLGLVVLALLGESIWETLKMFWQNGKVSVDRIGSIVVALLLVFGSGLDLLSAVGIPLNISYLGLVFTGILVSRGANFVHDLLSKISNIQQIKDITAK